MDKDRLHASEPFSVWRDAAFVILLFILFREWMLPLVNWSDFTRIYELEPFLMAIALFLLQQYIRCPLYISLWLNVLICFAIVSYLFHDGGLWWSGWMETLTSDAAYLFEREWHRVSGEARTLLFLYGWSLIVYVVGTLLIERRSGAWFVIATLCYLLFLHYVTGTDTSWAVTRAFVAGMALVLINRHRGLTGETQHGSSVRNGLAENGETRSIIPNGQQRSHASAGLVVGICVLLAVTACSFWLADMTTAGNRAAAPVWANGSNSLWHVETMSAGKSGYDDNDERLGGRITPDRRLAFYARTSQLAYWKGETKSYYDGRGWRHDPYVDEDGGRGAVGQAGTDDERAPMTGSSPSGGVQREESRQGQHESHQDGVQYVPDEMGSGQRELGQDEMGQGQHESKQDGVQREEVWQQNSHNMEWTEQIVMPVDPSLGNIVFRGGDLVSVERMLNRAGNEISADQLIYDPAADKYVLPDGVHTAYYRIRVSLPDNGADDAIQESAPSGIVDSETSIAEGGESIGVGQSEIVILEGDKSVAGDETDPATNKVHAANDARESDTDGLTFDPAPYLQLPDALPDRVRLLAASVAGDEKDTSSKAKRIEQFLRNSFVYSMEKTEVPADDQDFVDHFLFEQQIGYCDHFSTAMVVLLRAEGVPARWVKGFASGEMIEEADGMYGLAVRHEHAHSWVEAYIPDRGWMTFEPTPPVADSLHTGAETGVSTNGTDVDITEAITAHVALIDEARSSIRGQMLAWVMSMFKPLAMFLDEDMRTRLWVMGAFLAAGLLATVAAVAILIRVVSHEWVYACVLLALRYSRSAREAAPWVERLWRHWYRRFGPRHAGQTLREYAASLPVHRQEQADAARTFAIACERLFYQDREPVRDWRRRLLKLWRRAGSDRN